MYNFTVCTSNQFLVIFCLIIYLTTHRGIVILSIDTSLSLARFLSIAESEVGVGSEFSLESMATSLGTNRRRIYDIINVLESLEMIVKQSKNWYMWLGREGLLATLAKLNA